MLQSGIFDRTHYELQAGRRFDSLEDAARDYLRRGGAAGLSPHPLFEPEWYQPETWRARPDALLAYVRSAEAGSPSPWFDDATYLAVHPEATVHPGRALGHFLATAQLQDPVPLPPGRPGSPTLGEVLDLTAAGVEEFAHFQVLRSAPRRGPWDAAADRAFVESWSQRPAPTPVDGLLVTVVMPVRNRPVQVVEAIRSVQDQSLVTWELVVVDDGSTDATPDVVAGLAREDPRIRLVRLEPSGVSAARNAGIDAARAPWLAFLDSDNTWLPHFLQVVLAYLDASALRAGYCVIDASQSTPDPDQGFLTLDAGLDHLLVRNHIDLNGLVVATDVARRAGAFDPALRRWVDHDFAIRVARETAVRLVPFVGVRYDHAESSSDRITLTESEHWQWVALAKNYVDWELLASALGQRFVGRVSICMPTYEDWRLTATAVSAVLSAADAVRAGAPGSDVEVVVVDNGSRRAVAAILRALFRDEERVRLRAVPRNLNFAIGSNLAFAESSGEVVVFLNNDTEVLTGWLPPLLESLSAQDVVGVQPLLLYPDATVQSAGTVFAGGPVLPSPLLVNHPPDDARRLGATRLRAVTAAALAMRARDVVDLRGFDPLFVNGFEDVDLCLRAVTDSDRRFAVATDSVVLHHESRTPGRGARVQANRRLFLERWRERMPPGELDVLGELGLEVAHMTPGETVSAPGDVRMPRPVVVRPARVDPVSGVPSLRWALKTSTSVREQDSTDLRRAEALAEALRARGQDVVVDRVESAQRPTSYLDDVAVTVRGAQPLVEEPARVNLLWILPGESVDHTESARYDAVLEHAPGADDLAALAHDLLDRALELHDAAPWPRPSAPGATAAAAPPASGTP